MQQILISEARKQWGALLRDAQRNEVPFTVLLRRDPACVAAPHTWFKRACRNLDPAPELSRADTKYAGQRLQLGDLILRVLRDGAFISVPRLEGTAVVLVPIPWYEERVNAIGPPAGDVPQDPPKEESDPDT